MYWKEILSRYHFSNTNTIWNDLVMNPFLRVENLATELWFFCVAWSDAFILKYVNTEILTYVEVNIWELNDCIQILKHYILLIDRAKNQAVVNSTMCSSTIIGRYYTLVLIFIGPMSSSTRQRFPLYQAQHRAQIDTLIYYILY
jgi:hypothetical protein